MYEKFYGLRKAPFANIPDPRFLFMSSQHEQALATLEYALVSRAGFCVFTGDIGAGKTTLLRRALQMLGDQFHFGVVSNSRCESFEELLCWILLSLDLDFRGKTKVEMYDELVQLLIHQHGAGTPVVLVIDEAQNLGLDLLEQLRMLSNVNSEKGQVLQIVLVGQPELWDLLHHPRLQQLVQRVSCEYFLEPLHDVRNVQEYVEHRVKVAGGAPGLFACETFPLIAEASRGVPRLINRICDHALLYGYSASASNITSDLVAQVLSDRAIGIASSAGAPVPPTVDVPSESERVTHPAEPAVVLGSMPELSVAARVDTAEKAVADLSNPATSAIETLDMDQWSCADAVMRLPAGAQAARPRRSLPVGRRLGRLRRGYC